MSRAFIEFDEVTKRYGALTVLDKVDLTVDRHEVVTLIGASGSGKSTLLRCVNGLEDIQDGRILLDGDVVSGEGVDLVGLRRRVGIVFQSFNLFPHMTVLRNCTLTPIRAGVASRAEAEANARTMLERVGLKDKADAYPHQLSGGQQQRVAIARAMLMRPRALLLDEITSALDPELVIEVLNLVRELATDGITMMMTTHEMPFAREISSKVCFLHQGTILEQGPPEQIFEAPSAPELRSFLRKIHEAGRD
ncbi:amino acid ABC transporter ATP-binding protein, PAAT family [Micromonospora pallida]|uniref:Amino acid ABC transporter ATP-binding protein, PAAT family n=1 Tax=Micromonospora pallida TaxID=145854 RepID=A0A1C6S7W1_9ACTN|nr:amino acid ABC transporter ATP-binding protein [Micromonospora pallida]SCL25471.1 amino acid ABC transporter ATP-binding protein, PAAT family [Micromonospora pallida]